MVKIEIAEQVDPLASVVGVATQAIFFAPAIAAFGRVAAIQPFVGGAFEDDVDDAGIALCLKIGGRRVDQFDAVDVVGVHTRQHIHYGIGRQTRDFVVDHHHYALLPRQGDALGEGIDLHTRRALQHLQSRAPRIGDRVGHIHDGAVNLLLQKGALRRHEYLVE